MAGFSVLSPNGSLKVTGVPAYEDGTWTPTDGSGAGLTFTSVSASYVKIGLLVFVQFDLTFPVTASGANVVIGGLPYTSGSVYGSMVTGYSNANLAITWGVPNAGTLIAAFTQPGGQFTNAQFSTFRFIVAGCYRAAA
jgi:hypothetical protein